MSSEEQSETQEPAKAPQLTAQAGTAAPEGGIDSPTRIGSWLKLNWRPLAPWMAAVVSILIAAGSLVNAKMSHIAIDIAIRDEYEKRRQAMESELRADLRQIRTEMSELRGLIPAYSRRSGEKVGVSADLQ